MPQEVGCRSLRAVVLLLSAFTAEKGGVDFLFLEAETTRSFRRQLSWYLCEEQNSGINNPVIAALKGCLDHFILTLRFSVCLPEQTARRAEKTGRLRNVPPPHVNLKYIWWWNHWLRWAELNFARTGPRERTSGPSSIR